MTPINFIILLLLTTQTITAQDIIYITKWKSEADVDIILVDRKINADVVVNEVEHVRDTKYYPNSWHFTETKWQSSMTIRIVQINNGNAVRVFIQKPPKRFVSYTQKQNYEKYFSKADRR